MSELTEYKKYTKDEVFEQVKHIIQSQLGCSEGQITSSANMIFDLGADSLDSIEIIMAAEEDFDIFISEEAAEKSDKTVGSFVDIIYAQLEKNKRVKAAGIA